MSVKKQGDEGKYHFALYIDSEKPKCFPVADRLHRLCEQYLYGSYDIEVIDLRQDHSLFEQLRIIVAPTLDVTTPQAKIHRFVGDLSQSELFIVALGMSQEADKMGQQASKMGEVAVKMRDKIQSP
jgi:RecA/RadA recombinase